VETEPPSFDVSDEEPTFEEEPVSLDGGDTHEEEAELDLSLDEEAEEVEEVEEISLVEEEPAAPIELTSEAEEMELEIVADDEEGPMEPMEEEEEEEEIEVEIETEPSMAADGDSPLVGLLGDDIDSLIDSTWRARPPCPWRHRLQRRPESLCFPISTRKSSLMWPLCWCAARRNPVTSS
jgi:hypothetical protein